MNVSNKNKEIVEIFRNFGINHNMSAKEIARLWGEIEPPVRISETRIFHDFSMGAFSYVSGGFLYHTHIGRYCSLANQLHIGQGNHPVDWLSTHPFQYQQGIFDVRDGFEFKAEYEADRSAHVKNAVLGRPQPTRIGNDCWIAHGVYIKNGVTIGDGAVIGARSVVTKDIPPYAMAVGSPAKIIKFRFDELLVERLLRLQWWRFAPWQMRGLDMSNPSRALDGLEQLIDDGLEEYRPKKLVVKR
ncbi:transferase [Sphingobium lactosutens]|uniref:CatB-related O-acetyltransferase n=1 Tax=Sphingobium lactosutens TaxID=522773 RepID=UPI00277B5C30|nr:CatB-related O-acetyltransferase [Sphingobium lactosutens]NWK94267.1 transferase [Sphingobium lactosutens]